MRNISVQARSTIQNRHCCDTRMLPNIHQWRALYFLQSSVCQSSGGCFEMFRNQRWRDEHNKREIFRWTNTFRRIDYVKVKNHCDMCLWRATRFLFFVGSTNFVLIINTNDILSTKRSNQVFYPPRFPFLSWCPSRMFVIWVRMWLPMQQRLVYPFPVRCMLSSIYSRLFLQWTSVMELFGQFLMRLWLFHLLRCIASQTVSIVDPMDRPALFDWLPEMNNFSVRT